MQISFLLYKVSVVAQGKSQFIDIIHCNLTLYDLILYSSQTDPSSEDSIRKYRQKCPQNSQKQKMAPYIYRFVINKLFHIPYTLYICVCVCSSPSIVPRVPSQPWSCLQGGQSCRFFCFHFCIVFLLLHYTSEASHSVVDRVFHKFAGFHVFLYFRECLKLLHKGL